MTALYPAPLILDEGEEVLFHNVYAIVPEESVIGGFWSFGRTSSLPVALGPGARETEIRDWLLVVLA